MRNVLLSSSALAVLFSSGCGAGHTVAGLARTDLGCQQVHVRKVAKGQVSATGCGHAALYERQCTRGVGCTWTRHEPGSMPALAGATALSPGLPTQVLGSAEYGPAGQSRFTAAPAKASALTTCSGVATADRAPVAAPPPAATAPRTRGTMQDASELVERAFALHKAGKVDQAIPLMREALAIQERMFGPQHEQIAMPKYVLAEMLRANGDYEEARRLHQEALTLFERAPGANGLDLAKSLSGLAGVLSAQDKLSDAERLYRRALAMRERALGANHPDVAGNLNDLAEVLKQQGNYRAAEPLYLRALAIQERALGPNHHLVAMTLSNYAGSLHKRGELAAAEPHFRRALQILESTFGGEHQFVATALNNLASVLQARGELEAAEPLFRRALAILERVLPQNHPALGRPTNNLALIRDARGDYVEAEALYRRALTRLEASLGCNHPETAIVLINLAHRLEERGDYDGAEALLLRAIAILETSRGQDHPELATALNNLGALLLARGDLARAEAPLERALSLREKALRPDHPDLAITVNNLAVLYEARGDYAAADRRYRTALRTWEQRLGREHMQVATGLSNIGLLLYKQGDYAGARPLYDRALAIRMKALGPNHVDVATLHNNIGLLCYAQRDYAGAEASFRRALIIMERVLGPDHPKVATVLDNLGLVHSERGDGAAAEPYYRRSLAILERAFSDERPEASHVINNLAALMHERGDHASAEALYKRAIAINERFFGPDYPESASLHNNLSLLYIDMGRVDQAVLHEQKALHIEEKLLVNVFPTLVERQRQAFSNMVRTTAELVVATHLQLAAADPRARDLAITTLLQRKGRVLEASTDMVRRLRAQVGGPEHAKLEQLGTLRSELATRTRNGPAEHQRPEEHLAALRMLDQQLENLEAELGEHDARFLPAQRSVATADVARALKPGQALVELTTYRLLNVGSGAGKRWGPEHYAVYVLHADGGVGFGDLGEVREVDARVAALRTSLAEQRPDYRSAGRMLDAMVMEPTRTLLGTVRDVYLSPDGALNLIPFATLVDESEHFLAETMDVTYITSGRDLLRQRVVSAERGLPLALVAPDYQAQAGAKSPGVQHSPTGGALKARSSDLTLPQFPPLPGTLQEGAALKQVVPGMSIISGAAASESALSAVHGPRILHVATHGFFEADQPEQGREAARGVVLIKPADAQPATAAHERKNPLLRSGIALAGANRGRSAQGDDGVMTAMEMTGLDLWGTKLVTLSACETGLGKVQNGEGVYGLRRALVLAGAESSLVSLWQVADRETADLMSAYYTKLEAGAGRSAALRDVQRAAIANGAHPYFWAAFIASGDPRPLRPR